MPQLPRNLTLQVMDNAVCQQGFIWAFNSHSQSPCDIAAILGGVCNNGAYSIPPLPPSSVYYLDDGTNDPCQCSSVFYSLMCACSACQNHEFRSWPIYSSNCTNSFLEFSPVLPAGTAVPHYAYQLYTPTDNIFNVTAAEFDTGPESVAPPQPTTTTASTTTTVSSTETISVTRTAISSGKTKSIAGAVAGGVVGGIVFFTLVALVYWFVVRRGRSQAQSTATVNRKASGDFESPPSMNYTSPRSLTSTHTSKLYDPSDPSTFPPTSTHPDSHSFRYSGVPEL